MMQRFLIFLIVFIFAANISYAKNKISKAQIIDIQFIGQNIPEYEKLLQLSNLKIGDTYSESKIEKAKSNLRKLKLFESIQVKKIVSQQKYQIQFLVKPGYLIRNINFKGNFPIIERKIRRALILSSGSLLNLDQIPEQIDRLLKFYEKEGYFNSEIIIQYDYDDEKNLVDLELKIHKGRSYRIKKIIIEGQHSLQDTWIKNKIRSFSHFKPRKLKSSLKTIRKRLIKKGYLRSRVKLVSLDFNDDNRTVNIKIKIHPGKNIQFDIRGQKKFTKKQATQKTHF